MNVYCMVHFKEKCVSWLINLYAEVEKVLKKATQVKVQLHH